MIVVSKPEDWPLEYYPKDVEEKDLVLSHYAIVVEHEGGYVLHHTISWSMFYLTKEEYDDVLNNEMFRNYKIVLDKSIDEDKIAEDVYLRRAEKEGPFTFNQINTVVIMTTTHCNARCSYCYEKGINKVKMSLETAEKVVKYLDRVIPRKEGQPRTLKIQWFGGEPLLNTEVMDYITEQLEGRGIEVSSTMITNGYLFNEENIAKIDKWHLQQTQITLDGPRDMYNSVKNYVVNDPNPFETVINNIKNLLERTNVAVTIRVNACEENIDSIDELLFYLKDKFGGYFNTGHLNLDVTQIYQIACEEYGRSPIGFDEKLNYVRDKHKDIVMGRPGFKGGIIKKRNLTFCGADNGGMNVIAPDGKIGPCEHWSEENVIGTIETGPTNKEVMEKWRRKDGENIRFCKEMRCPVLPTCRHSYMCKSSPICSTKEKFQKAFDWEKECIKETFNTFLRDKAIKDEIELEDDET